MKKIFFVILIILCLLFIVGCGIKEGYVYDKYYKGPYTTTGFIMCGKIMVPTTYYHSESWHLCIKNTQNGKEVYDDWSVFESNYNSINIGDYVKINK